MSNVVVYYLIEDGQDGSASLRLFKTEAARDRYLEEVLDYCYDMSEGGSYITQAEIDEALDMEGVEAEIAENEDY
jgi:hypothetical protein